MQTIYLALGSNLGDREQWLETAIQALSQSPDISIENISPFLETDPVGNIEQPKFLNTTLKAHTLLTPQELLETCEAIERQCGRQSKGDWTPRTVDIDILFYGQDLISTESLQIPHPLVQDRRFVLEPLAQIAPDFIHPTYDKSIQQLLEDLEE